VKNNVPVGRHRTKSVLFVDSEEAADCKHPVNSPDAVEGVVMTFRSQTTRDEGESQHTFREAVKQQGLGRTAPKTRTKKMTSAAISTEK